MWVVFVVYEFKSPSFFIDPGSLESAMKKELAKKTSPPWVQQTLSVAYLSGFGGIPVADEDLPESQKTHPEKQGLKQFRMDGGALVTAWEGYTLEDVKLAYVISNNEISNKRRLEYIRALFKQFLFYIIPLLVIYLLGWMFGWIYRGFRKN